MSKQRVVVTGLGALTPLGNTVATSWAGILDGRSGVRRIDRFDVSAMASQIAATLNDFDVAQFIPAKEIKKMEPFIHYGMAAAIEAIEDAGLISDSLNYDRVGTLIGSGIGGLEGIERNTMTLEHQGARRVSPFFVPGAIVNMVSGQLSIRYGFRGPNLATVTACAAGTHSIGQAARLIAYGDADVMIAGGSEGAVSPLGVAGFSAARALSTRNDDPEHASRPWDKDRDGFVLGEGAGVLVLESYDHAKARDAHIYGELIGFGMSADAYHMTAPSADGDGARRCMLAAMQDAKLNPEDIGYVNAHGTSTQAGDMAEVAALHAAFGDYAKRCPVSSTKSMTGHLLGAAGGIEAVFSLLALRDQVLPPTVNLFEPSEGCDLDFVPHTARQVSGLDVVMSNSFGFGGTNGTLIFRRL
ncbi:beta-ketoacyl-ACP synthase II [Halothiobacillus neapolitanus]|uniref:3-oxoacyl-[acyl-carrier-protein] synthase 2 n=1 Tax=Halothiobacillus neapolitanus (strain ATCC 23641 / DSM 15147 / CIP 104769 / NCIMB 8539 / c2) TaxID=555778 RepID=D0L221_HALNC|nr:beta-ketoacyl-ACP synthase II [Halothiobacillus neapolitanus]ACX96744.1 3-oxoacyl-(acyl-carrier-protein) synthase 2 [Halothiobacillus neapolitanus c2]TDN65147.1 3-oxoacyl-[acyl-carrier-protein] synthase II [Halothiobacillus neapolitanus]